MANPQDMSVEEVLAACRRMDGGGEPAAAPADESAAAEPTASEPAAESPQEAESPPQEQEAGATEAAPAAKPSADMSIEEMMAAARAEKAKPKASAAAAKKPAKKAAAKPSAAGKQASPKSPEKKKPSGPMDTTSILAAARAERKPGPISKAEAAAKGESPAKDRPAKGKPAKAKPEVPPMPEKPAYAAARPSREAEEAGETRRGFMASLAAVTVGSSMAVGFTTLAISHLLWLLGLARFMFPNIRTEPPMQFKVGFPDDYAAGQVETKYKAQFGVWIVKYEFDGQPQVYALQSVCTHLGCTPNWLEGEQKFKCPCHGSGFYKDGVNFEGPAPRPLERFAIRLADDGQLEVDKSRKFQEEMGQWSDPASFYPV